VTTDKKIIQESIRSWQESLWDSPLIKRVGAASIALSLIHRIVKIIKDSMDKATKSCVGYQGTDHSICISKFKISITKNAISKLKTGMSKCKNDKKCSEKINNKIGSLNNRLKVYREQLRLFMRKK